MKDEWAMPKGTELEARMRAMDAMQAMGTRHSFTHGFNPYSPRNIAKGIKERLTYKTKHIQRIIFHPKGTLWFNRLCMRAYGVCWYQYVTAKNIKAMGGPFKRMRLKDISDMYSDWCEETMCARWLEGREREFFEASK